MPSQHLKLYVLRHADAEKANYERDFERQITSYGVSQMERLRERGLRIDAQFALVSSAARTRKTFELLNLKAPCHFVDELYEADYKKFQRAVSAFAPLYPNCEALLFVGHNPFVSDLSARLSGESVQLGTADLVLLEIENFSNFPEALEATKCWSIKPL